MSTLLVLGYPSEAEATSAYQKILDLDKNLIVSLQSIAVVARRADGKYDVVTPGSKVGTSAFCSSCRSSGLRSEPASGRLPALS